MSSFSILLLPKQREETVSNQKIGTEKNCFKFRQDCKNYAKSRLIFITFKLLWFCKIVLVMGGSFGAHKKLRDMYL